MKFENTGIEQLRADLERLDEVMLSQGLVREGQWDYERVTYDKKFELKDGTYYLRLRGYAVEGDIDSRKAIIQLLPPLLGKHYYPHGVEYGEGEQFPASLVNQCKNLLDRLKGEIEAFAE
ncbi:YugN family protein [Bacillus sp. FJAT-27245]|uniref:YugN family protein n=1 Tax=Bacillus sp. FJAT-27245 TaxID=1684144 RepID=UPI0006A77169|nr:YugN family protein [Bacillus sp. FJAT-27245]